MFNKKFAIIGAGPIGGIFGGFYAKNGGNVALVDIIESHIEACKNICLEISNLESVLGIEDISVKIKNGFTFIGDLAGYSPNYIVIATKAPVLEKIIPELKNVYKEVMKLVSLQNGLDTEAPLVNEFGAENVIRIVPNYAGKLIQDGQIRMNWFQPPNYVGALGPEGNGDARYIAEMLTKIGLKTEYTDNIRRYEWKKTILNAGLCAICAVTDMTMKDTMENSHYLQIVRDVLNEGYEVAKNDGYDFADEYESKEGFIAHCIAYLNKGGHHLPSTAVDINKGLTTEIDVMNGRIVELGKKYGVDTPANMCLTLLVKGREVENLKKANIK